MKLQKHLAISREEKSRMRPRHLADVYRVQKKSTEKKGLKTNRCTRETLRWSKRYFPKGQQRKFGESLKTSQFLAERKAGRAALYQQRLAENRARSRKQLRQEERRARNITDGRAFFSNREAPKWGDRVRWNNGRPDPKQIVERWEPEKYDGKGNYIGSSTE